jgi:WD40 repeat protein
MPNATGRKVFISYARIDGAELAQRLQGDLRKKRYDAWVDTHRIRGGSTWTTEIETAIDEADYVLALLTPGSYASEICRAEQLRALRKGKCVVPLKAKRGTDIPLHLEQKNYRDFTTNSNYAKGLAEILEDIRAHKGVPLKEEFRETYVTAPPLPMNYVARPEALATLRDALITDGSGRHIALTALEGMGGIGKTVLAKALCHDEVVQQAFPDGVIWVTAGKEAAFDALTRLCEVGKALKDNLDRYDNELGATNQYRSTIRNKAALIVIDDVWKAKDLEPLLAESTRSRMLFTTRDADIAAAVGAREQVADLLNFEQSREVLARWSAIPTADLPWLADDLVRECGRLPLALSMVGAMLRGKPSTIWKRIHGLLRNADLGKISAQFPDYPYPSLLAAIQVSIDELDATTRDRYLALAVLLEDMPAAPAVQQCLWKVDELEAAETAGKLVSLSLAQRDSADGGIRLHDLQLDYVRAQYPDRAVLNLIQEAVRLSSHAIAYDSLQFASQVGGRLMVYASNPAIAGFVSDVSDHAQHPWLRPLWPSLNAPAREFVRTLITGHSSWISGVAVSGNGRRAVSASLDTTLKVWDVESGRELRTLIGHSAAVIGVALSADGRRAVSASEDGTLRVWDVESGRELRTLIGHSAAVIGVALSADGRRAVSASRDTTLRVWDVESGRELRTLIGHSAAVSGVALSGDGRRAVSASVDKTLQVWDVESGRELRSLKGRLSYLRGGVAVSGVGRRAVRDSSDHGVAMSGDGRRAVSASFHKTLKVWDVESGRELRTLKGHSRYLYGVALSPDGRLAVSASSDKTLKVWDVESGRELRTLIGHSDAVSGVALSGDARRAVSASHDNTLKVWDMEGGRELRTLTGHDKGITGVVVSGNGRLAVSASQDHTLKVWDVESGRELRTLTGHSRGITGVAVSGDGRRAVSASQDTTLKVWNVDSGCELRTLTAHSGQVVGVGVSADGRMAVSAYHWTLKVWELESGRELRTLSGHTGPVRDVALSPDGRLAVSASSDKTLKVWELDSGRELRTLQGHTGPVRGVALSPDGRLAVSASQDGTLKVWDVDSGRELRTLQGHSGALTGVAVSGDGRLAVAASSDKVLKVWDMESGETLAKFTCDDSATCCTFVNNRRIIAGDQLGRIHLLQLEMPV